MNKKTLFTAALPAFAAAILLAPAANAHHAGKANASYVGDHNGHYITDGSGNCVRTGTWQQEDMTVDCGAEPVAEAPAPAPVVAPPPPEPVYETISLSTAALFDVNKATLKPAALQELDALAERISKDDRVVSVKIVGHTDNTGTESYNQDLSLRRAAAVRDYAVSKGANADIISVSGMGESSPIADNNTSAGRAKNRRVEVTVGVTRKQ